VHSPLFTIVVPHYQWDGKAGIKHEDFMRGIKCLQDQTFTDYEVLVIHDGPAVDTLLLSECPFKVKCLAVRYNNWGHSSRDVGIKMAKGEYIIHFNPDNILYPYALEEIANVINDTSLDNVIHNYITERSGRQTERGVWSDKWGSFYKNRGCSTIKDIIIFPIWLIGVIGFGIRMLDIRKGIPDIPELSKIKHLMLGYPVLLNNIDCMQLVMKKSVWLKFGGWYDKTENADGIMYPRILEQYKGGCTHLYTPLGEHY
jgi:glycosyltransferase involved in cell wall biosynthesis